MTQMAVLPLPVQLVALTPAYCGSLVVGVMTDQDCPPLMLCICRGCNNSLGPPCPVPSFPPATQMAVAPVPVQLTALKNPLAVPEFVMVCADQVAPPFVVSTKSGCGRLGLVSS